MLYFLPPLFCFLITVCHAQECPFYEYSEEEIQEFLCPNLFVLDDMDLEYEFSWGYVGAMPNGYHIVWSDLIESYKSFYYKSKTYHVLKDEKGALVETDNLPSYKGCEIYYGEIEGDLFTYRISTNEIEVFQLIGGLSSEFKDRLNEYPEDELPYFRGYVAPSFVYGAKVNKQGKFESGEILGLVIPDEDRIVQREDFEAFGLSLLSLHK